MTRRSPAGSGVAAPAGYLRPIGCAWEEATVEALFDAAGALRDGHFLLKSGRHSPRYLEKFAVLQYPALGVEIGRRLADALAPYEPTLVVGPTTGGVLLAFETARQLAERAGREVRGIFAEPLERGRRALRRGWPVTDADRIVLVDDILTTGASLLETIAAVRGAGGEPLAAAVVVDRSAPGSSLGMPLHALGRIEIASWVPDECPLCREGIPAEKPGSS
ncbi:MAG TPA: orotate phosphoribosyltransferase [Candidatus Limnocylindria bacterium]|nr:orotate phosphoribosyltransferase [Candidatus Limnocylindria bacterium]